MSSFAQSYPYVMRQALIWRDMDAFQHVNNAVYFRYFEDLRMAFFAEAGIIAYMDEHRVGPILASTRCNFRAPLTFPGEIQIGGSVVELKQKHFTMKYAVVSGESGVLAAEGEGILVYYNYALGRSCEIPPTIRDALQRLCC